MFSIPCINFWRSKQAKHPRHAEKARFRPVRPQLECLEDRLVPALFVVTTTADDGALTSLRAAIDAANANGPASDTIRIDTAGTYGLALAAGDLDITSSMKIFNASGAEVDIRQFVGNERVFDIADTVASVSIKGVTISSGSTGADGVNGAGIRSAAAKLILTAVSVAGNDADADAAAVGVAVQGGGLFNAGGTVTIKNSVFAFNRADGGDGTAGAGGAGLGGAIYNNGGIVSITNSTIADNDATGGNGADGAAIFFFGGLARGAGIFNEVGTVTLLRSVISGNAASGGSGGNGTGGIAGGAGGNVHGAGIATTGGKLTLQQSSVANNSANAGVGGVGSAGIGIEVGRSGGTGGNSLGGGIYAASDATVKITGSFIAGNFARGGSGGGGGMGGPTNGFGGVGGAGGFGEGGGIWIDEDVLSVISSDIVGNEARGGTGGTGGAGGGAFGFGGTGGIGGNGQGGGFTARFAAIVTVTKTNVSSNNARLGAGGAGGNGSSTGADGLSGVGRGGGAFVADTASLALVSSLVMANLDGNSSGTFIEGVDATITESGSTLIIGNFSND